MIVYNFSSFGFQKKKDMIIMHFGGYIIVHHFGFKVAKIFYCAIWWGHGR